MDWGGSPAVRALRQARAVAAYARRTGCGTDEAASALAETDQATGALAAADQATGALAAADQATGALAAADQATGALAAADQASPNRADPGGAAPAGRADPGRADPGRAGSDRPGDRAGLSRRTMLGGAGVAALAAAMPAWLARPARAASGAPAPGTGPRVVIIGAGLARLGCAYRLWASHGLAHRDGARLRKGLLAAGVPQVRAAHRGGRPAPRGRSGRGPRHLTGGTRLHGSGEAEGNGSGSCYCCEYSGLHCGLLPFFVALSAGAEGT